MSDRLSGSGRAKGEFAVAGRCVVRALAAGAATVALCLGAAVAREPQPIPAPVTEAERTRVLVLATTHLAAIEDGVPAGSLAGVLRAIEDYRPDAIAVESLPGAEIARLTRSAAVDPEGAEAQVLAAFAAKTSELGLAAQVALGLSFESARTKTALLLKTAPADAEARRVLVAHLLAAYDMPSAVLQWSYLGEDERRATGSLSEPMVEFLNHLLRSNNEIVSVAAAGARRIGLQRLASVDDHSDDEEMVRVGSLDRLMEELQASKQYVEFMESEFFKQQLSAHARAAASGDLTQLFRWLNSAEYASRDVAGQWHLFYRTRLASGLDRNRAAMWEARNLAIAARIRAETAAHPGGKVLVVIGAAHRPFIEAYLASMMDVQIVPLSQVLGGADQPADQAAPQGVPAVSSPPQPR